MEADADLGSGSTLQRLLIRITDTNPAGDLAENLLICILRITKNYVYGG